MKYAIDRIESEIVIYQNLETKEILEGKREEFPEKIKEGDIVVFFENKFIIDEETAAKRKESLRVRLERLKNLK